MRSCDGKVSQLVLIAQKMTDVALAVQSVGVQESDGYVAYWSESHVSEDFDIALRLQTAGMITRCANYHNNEFKEGVSLTIYDEISRWEK